MDAVSGATPKDGIFTVDTKVPIGSGWAYYIEVNISGDYNEAFPYWSKSGYPDSEGNGQPSIVYQGNIVADENTLSIPKLIGRTEQRKPINFLIPNIDQITTAKMVITNIRVKCSQN